METEWMVKKLRSVYGNDTVVGCIVSDSDRQPFIEMCARQPQVAVLYMAECPESFKFIVSCKEYSVHHIDWVFVVPSDFPLNTEAMLKRKGVITKRIVIPKCAYLTSTGA